jgi:hypothetical protein
MRILQKRGAGLAAAVLGALATLATGCGGSSAASSSATTTASTAATTAAATASAVRARLTFFPSVVRVKANGVAVLVAGCSGPPQTEACAVSLVLKAPVHSGSASTAHVQVGTVSGRTPGGITGNVTLRLNAAGRRYLKAGTLHVDGTGTVTTTTARLVTQVHRRITLKKA